MSDLIVVAYPDVYRAAEVLNTLRRLEVEHLIDLEDAAYVTRDIQGIIKLHQSLNLTTEGALEGAFWGSLIGLLFLNPIAGGLIGAGAGALGGSATDIGVNDEFMREVGASIAPGSSALFLLVLQSTPDKVIPELAKYGGTVLRTSLSDEAESRLRNALATGESSAATTEAPTPVAPVPVAPTEG